MKLKKKERKSLLSPHKHANKKPFSNASSFSNFAFIISPEIEPEKPANGCREGTTSSQQTKSPATTFTTIDGNVHFTEPRNVRMSNNIKINIKNSAVHIITDAERAARNSIDSANRKKAVPTIARRKADETSALCTIM